MNLENNEIRKFLEINSKWEKCFGRSLVDGLFEEFEDIKKFINVVKEELLSLRKKDNKYLSICCIEIQGKLKELKIEQLQSEYQIIREFYIYSLTKKENTEVSLKAIYKWIEEMFSNEVNQVITLDILKDTLDEQLFYE